MNHNHTIVTQPTEFTKRFLQIAVPLLLLLFAIATTQFFIHQKLETMSHSNREVRNIELARQVLAQDLRTVVSDLLFLASINEFEQLLDQPTTRTRKLLERELAHFSHNKGLYDQIRYLDINGMERVRINNNLDEVHIVADDRLQNKSDRYYFNHTLGLYKGDIYLSIFDLNIENNTIEKPYKPVIRFATPVFNQRHERKGILVLNYLGNRLIKDFRQATANISDHAMLVNQDGFWLSSPSQQDEWGFMLQHKRSFATVQPEAWQKIITTDSGQFRTPNGLFTYATFYPAEFATNQPTNLITNGKTSGFSQDQQPSRYWKVISHVSPEILSGMSKTFLRRNLPLYSAIGILILLGSVFLTRAWIRHRYVVAQTEYERRFRSTMENMQLAAISIDIDGKMTFFNDYLLQQTGWSREDFSRDDWQTSFVPETDQGKVRNMLANLKATGKFPPNHESHIMTREEEVLLFSWSNTLSYDEHGNVSGMTCIGEDITDLRQNEEQLRKLSRAVEQSPSTVMITNTKGVVEYVNPKFVKLTGYQPNEVIGHNPHILKSGETSQEEYENLWQTITKGHEWRGEFHNRKKNGELYWEAASISPIRNADGEITHFLAVKEDITERKRLQQEVEERNRQLAHNQALAAMGRMASMIAHDLRNPLSSIKMGLQILGKQASENWGQEAEELQKIGLEQVRYMENILTDLLRFSRPDALQPEWLSINKLLDMAIGTTQKLIQEHGINVITEYQSQLPTIHGDATKLRQVFANLITNALQATDGIDRIPEIRIRTTLDLTDQPPNIHVEICDNGPGISAEEEEKIFEPFYTTRAKGTGLGLPIVKRILDQHHGSIELVPNNIKGTCVIVILPTEPLQE
jgi:PAS domain S-box-containing protein